MNYHRLYRACGLLSRPNRIPALKRFLGSDSQGLSSKYSEKLRRKSEETGLSLSELIKQADEEKSAARLAEAEQLRKSNERFKKSSVIGTGTDGSQAETASLKKRQDAAPFKELSSILNMERVFSRPHSQEEISDLWMAYLASRSGGTGRGYVGASIPLEMFERMARTGRTYPTFVVAVPKEIEGSDASEGEGKTGHELFYLQWDWHPAPSIPREAGDKTGSTNPATCTILFTPLQEYKLRQSFATPYLVLTMYTDLAATHGVVLMKGEITPGSGGRWMLRQEDAQRLVMGLQKYYLWGEKDKELVKIFHERPEEFVWERLLENI